MAAKALTGWTVGVTADRRADEQCQLLQRAGAAVVHAPVIRTLPLGPDGALRNALASIIERPPDIVVLTTGIGTRTLFEVADALGLSDAVLDALSPADVYVRGPKANGAAQTAGLTVTWQAPNATSAELVQHLERRGLRNERIAVQLDGRDRPVLGDDLRRLAADVVDLPVYRWTLPDDRARAEKLVDAVCEQRIDAVTFTSSPALSNMIDLAGDRREQLVDALEQAVTAVSVGRVCTGTARDLGVKNVVEPERPRLGAMVHALSSFAARENKRRTVAVDGVPVTLHASTAVIGDVVIDLADRERAVLSGLLDRPGAVVSKAKLVQLWPRNTDPHVAEVAVSRLRRRLDGHLRIRAVPQRGYVLTRP
jgi:uroporphyrinogen-III synthase